MKHVQQAKPIASLGTAANERRDLNLSAIFFYTKATNVHKSLELPSIFVHDFLSIEPELLVMF